MAPVRGQQGLFLVSAALFIAGIAFLVVGARARPLTAGAEAAVRPEPAIVPAASVKQIMNAIVMPNATAVYDAVGSSVTAAGVVEIAPDSEEKWAAVVASAAVLVEAGNLMLTGNRRVDQDQWLAMTEKFTNAARAAMAAAQAKKTEALLDAGGDVAVTCDICHERYQRR